jgi:Fe-Mn family superoxide dismutase
MSPKAGGEPKDTLAMAIVKDFGSFENFKKQFKNMSIR